MSWRSEILSHPTIVSALLDHRPIWICLASSSLWISIDEGWHVLKDPTRASRCDGLCQHVPLAKVKSERVLEQVATLLRSVPEQEKLEGDVSNGAF